ncbi:MAG TPA: TetR/AcrR family transcriptional regulator [Actinocrinis sp.]|nr:TetR/AcrR family transcriptional regulator [Actinocrinis sp.]
MQAPQETDPGRPDAAPAAAPAAKLTRKGQATRDRILAAAAGLMHERGVAGTSTEDVQLAAGVNPSQLYYYFKDKRALVAAVIAYQTESVVGCQELSRLDSVEALRAWRDFAVQLQHDKQFVGGCPIGSLGSELAEADDLARGLLAAAFARWQAAIRAGLRDMQERGELPPGPRADPDKLGLAVLAALQGGLLLTKVRRDTLALEAALDTTLDQIESLIVR